MQEPSRSERSDRPTQFASVRENEGEDRVLRPNMLLANGNATSSTLVNIDFSHSVMTRLAAFNARIHTSNFEGAAFDEGDFDGAIFTGCSMRGVELVNCDVDHLVVNGVNVGNLLRLLLGEEGRFQP
jgi:uncharacterized protein YjbI with pentapeptide repeats